MLIHKFDGVSAIYLTDENKGITTFTLVPSGMEDKVLKEKMLASFLPYGHLCAEPMVQVAFTGDSPTASFSAGISMRNYETALRLRFVKQDVIDNEEYKEVITYLEDAERGVKATHHVKQVKGFKALELYCSVQNTSKNVKTLEFIDSFSIGCLSPFVLENNPDRMVMHRIGNNWSGEGRFESRPVSSYNMEDSWSSFGTRLERFGQVGTMPARRYLPFVAMEDLDSKVVWAASMEAPASWQIEAGHFNSNLLISGGQADYNFGHWRKDLNKGETFTTNKAFVSVVQDTLLNACQNIAEYQFSRCQIPESEEDLPIIFNEYTYSWGNPSLEKVRAQIGLAKQLGAKYFVVDAGWFLEDADNSNWSAGIGDWNVNKTRFPGGLKEYTKLCAEYGMKSGVWFEFENVNTSSKIFKKKDLLLKLDGKTIVHKTNAYLDFRNPDVIEYLDKKVIDQVIKSGIKYIKVDYNNNIGLGCDGAESVGEGLRQHIEAVINFFKRIKERVPDLIIEICSSGGMRHEPKFNSLGSMCSFSDLHVVPEGAVSAADLHRVFLPRYMQIWATLNADFSEERVIYAMAQGMLGRLCISGDINALSDKSKAAALNGSAFYQKIKHVIKDGITLDINTDHITSLRHLHSAFSLTRMSKDKEYILFYAFRVNGKEKAITRSLPKGYKLVEQYGNGKTKVKNGKITVKPTKANEFATVVLLKKEN